MICSGVNPSLIITAKIVDYITRKKYLCIHFKIVHHCQTAVIEGQVSGTIRDSQNIVNKAMPELLSRPVISKTVSLVAAQSIPSVYPDKSIIILVESTDAVHDKAITDGVSTD